MYNKRLLYMKSTYRWFHTMKKVYMKCVQLNEFSTYAKKGFCNLLKYFGQWGRRLISISSLDTSNDKSWNLFKFTSKFTSMIWSSICGYFNKFPLSPLLNSITLIDFYCSATIPSYLVYIFVHLPFQLSHSLTIAT